ncbi:MAG: glycosyltransferase [Bacteroidota bacterium]
MWFLLLAPTLAYAVFVLGVAVVMARARYRDREPTPPLPRIAVLVAARNEEARLPRCLDALLAQDYPADRLDLFVANDHSTDDTAAVIERYRAQNEANRPAVHAVAVPEPSGHLRGKALAIHAAFEASDHGLLLVTDADCAPPPGWARSLVAYFDEPETGMVCGHTYVEHRGDWLTELQALDWSYLLAICSALVETGRPVTAMGNNMAFRRAAYEAVGGYPALPFSVTEDYMLFRAVYEQTAYRLRYPADPALRNYTLPLGRLVDVYQQRRRWARGGTQSKLWVHGLYTVTHLAHFLPLIALFVLPGPTLAVLGLKVGADFAALWATLGTRRGLVRVFPLWEAYLFFYLATLPTVLLLFPRINWKDRKL